MPAFRRLLLVLSVALTMGERTMAAPETARFTQDRFAIGFWVDPPADEKMDAHYAEIAEANFTLVIGGFGARPPPGGGPARGRWGK